MSHKFVRGQYVAETGAGANYGASNLYIIIFKM